MPWRMLCRGVGDGSKGAHTHRRAWEGFGSVVCGGLGCYCCGTGAVGLVVFFFLGPSSRSLVSPPKTQRRFFVFGSQCRLPVPAGERLVAIAKSQSQTRDPRVVHLFGWGGGGKGE